MTEKTLKSLKFHGLDDIYKIPSGGNIEIELEGESTGSSPGINATSLGGVLAKDYATKSFVQSEIAKAQPDGSEDDINLDAYVTKDELRDELGQIKHPVSSVNGQTGTVELTAEGIGAASSVDVSNAKTAAVSEANSYTNTQITGVKTYTNEQIKKASPYNFLDNSDFTNPVNQRGQGTYPLGGGNNRFTIDRWATTNGNTILTVNDNGITLTNTQAESGGYLRQRLIPLSKYQNRTFTLAVTLSNGQRVCASGTIPNAFNIKDGDKSIGGVMVSGEEVWVRIWSNANEDSRSFSNVALYEGAYTIDNLPDYQPKGYGPELAECMRYYQKHYMRFKGLVYTVVLPVPLLAPVEISAVYESVATPDYLYMVNNQTVDMGCYVESDVGGTFTFNVPI